MTFRTLFAVIFAVTCFNTASAQDTSGRIDLEAIAPTVKVVMARIVFAKTAVACPEDFGVLRISATEFGHHRPILPGRPAVASGFVSNLPDDETHLFRSATPDCRFDIAVRQQVLRADNWVSLLVPKRRRPSLSDEERRELGRQFSAQLMEDAKSISPERSARLKRAREAHRTIGSLWQGALMLSSGAVFDDRPATCFEAVGTYLIDQQAITFLFATGLPGDLNRFTIERTEIDDERSRLHFTGDNCRFELTIGKAVLQDGRWRAVPVAPYVRANEPDVRIRIRPADPDRERPE